MVYFRVIPVGKQRVQSLEQANMGIVIQFNALFGVCKRHQIGHGDQNGKGADTHSIGKPLIRYFFHDERNDNGWKNDTKGANHRFCACQPHPFTGVIGQANQQCLRGNLHQSEQHTGCYIEYGSPDHLSGLAEPLRDGKHGEKADGQWDGAVQDVRPYFAVFRVGVVHKRAHDGVVDGIPYFGKPTAAEFSPATLTK